MEINRIRASLAAVAAVAVAAGVSYAAVAPAGAATTRHTVVRAVRPVDRHGHLRPGYTVVTRIGGQPVPHSAICSFGSEAVNVAYRCFAGNFVLDPCWVARDRSRVYCQEVPWKRRVVRLDVHSYDNAGFRRTGARRRITTPWGVQTLSGRKAEWVQGAGCATRSGKRINYDLPGPYALAGSVQRTTSPWRIQRVKQVSGACQYRAAGHARLAKEWIGKPTAKGSAP